MIKHVFQAIYKEYNVLGQKCFLFITHDDFRLFYTVPYFIYFLSLFLMSYI